MHDIAARQFVEKGYKTGKVGREAYDVVTLPEMYAERIGRVAYELAEKRKNRLASVDLADTFNTEFCAAKSLTKSTRTTLGKPYVLYFGQRGRAPSFQPVFI